MSKRIIGPFPEPTHFTIPVLRLRIPAFVCALAIWALGGVALWAFGWVLAALG